MNTKIEWLLGLSCSCYGRPGVIFNSSEEENLVDLDESLVAFLGSDQILQL